MDLVSLVWAWLAIWLSWIWVAIGQWILWKASVEAMWKNRDLSWFFLTITILGIALVESAAIYGLVVSFKILGDATFESEAFIGMWLAIWLAGLWVSIWEGILANKAMEVMSKQEKMISFFLTVTILGIALVESAAIYGLVVAFDVFGKDLTMYAAIGSGLAIWLAGLWAWVWEGILVSWSMSAIARNPKIKAKLMTFMVLFVALVEVTAIYGLIVSFNISGIDAEGVDPLLFVWSWLAIWLSGLWVGIGRWYLSEESMKTMGKNPSMISFMLTVSILWVALVESAAIYALVVSFKLLWTLWLAWFASVAAGLAIGFAGLWAWVWEGLLIKWAVKWINNDPESKGKILAFMVLFVALVEVVAIYGLLIAFRIIG